MQNDANDSRTDAHESTEGVPSGYTYFLRDAEGIKIGRSVHPASRMWALQSGNSSKLELLVSVPCAWVSEADAHAKFAHLKIHREWFRPGPDLLEFIEKLKAALATKPRRQRRVLRPAPNKTATAISNLLALRRAHGFESTAGRRCSNLAEMLPIFEAATDPIQKAYLAANIQRQMSDLRQIRARAQ